MSDLLVLTRTVTPDECPWLESPIEAGTQVRRFHKVTYGCVDHSVGTAVTFDLAEGDYPFVELPTAALAPPVPQEDR